MKLLLSAIGLAAASASVTCDNLKTCGGTICWQATTESDFTLKSAWSSNAFPMATQKAIIQASPQAVVSTNIKVQSLRITAGSSLRIKSGKKLSINSGCSSTTGTCTACDATGGVCVQDGLCECNDGYKVHFTTSTTAYFDTDPMANCAKEDETSNPTVNPTVNPTSAPTTAPTAAPTVNPTAAPTVNPTSAPTSAPTEVPTSAPTSAPTAAPTASPVSLELSISKTQSDMTDSTYELYRTTLSKIYEDHLTVPTGFTAKDCIVIEDASGNYFPLVSGGRGGGNKFQYTINGACNQDESTSREYTRVILNELTKTSSENRVSTEMGETSAKAQGATVCPDGSEVPEGDSCAAPTAAASLPIIPIAAGGGGVLLLLVVFLLCRKKKKKSSKGSFDKYQVANNQPPARGRASGRRTSRGASTSRGMRTSRGSATGRRAPAPPGRGLPAAPKPSLFPPLAAPKPLISKKKTHNAALLGEA